MVDNVEPQLAATEHCDALQQCDDDGCHLWVGKTGLSPTPLRASRGLFHCLLALLFLLRGAVQEKRDGEEQAHQASRAEGTLQSQHHHQLHSPLRLRLRLRQESMGESGNNLCEFCLTSCLPFTLVSPPPPSPPLPVCRFGMNRRAAFTVCITLDFPYRVMSLHCTIDTAIRAVDDNQATRTDDNPRK